MNQLTNLTRESELFMLGDPTDGRLAHVTVVDGGAAEGVELTAYGRVVPVVV